jgi:hypothetical protein
MRTRAFGLLLVLLAAAPAEAQIPRTADGKPDFSGIWQALSTAAWNVEDHSAEKGVPAGQGVVEGGELPYLPESLKQRDENYRNRATADPETKCYLPGIPRMMYMPFPFQIVQTPTRMVMAFEYVNAVRHIFFTGEHPEGPIDWWQGDARARWEGDTLVVDIIHFNGETWFDRAGNFHSDAMHLVERYTMLDRNHINYEVTVEDPKVFSRPWTMRMPLYRRLEEGVQLLEYVCQAYIN